MKKNFLMLVIFIIFLPFYGCIDHKYIESINVYEEKKVDENLDQMSNSRLKDEGGDGLFHSFYSRSGKKQFFSDLNSEKEVKLYNLMKENVYCINENAKETGEYEIKSIVLKGYSIDRDTIRKVFRAFQYDNPEIFWLSNSINFKKYGRDTIITLKSVVSPSECKEIIEQLKIELSEAVKSVPSGLSEYDTELYFHDFLIKRCKYQKSQDKVPAWRKFTVVGTMIDGEAVCEGFAKTMKVLLNLVSVDCLLITGEKDGQHHMWNLVKVNGKWYHLDVTWDSSGGMGKYSYFNLSDSKIKIDHKIDREFTGAVDIFKNDKYNFRLPKCVSMDDNYIYKNGIRINSFSQDSDNFVVKQIKESIIKKAKYVYVVIGEGLNYDYAVKELFSQPSNKFFKYLAQVDRDKNIKNRIDRQKIYILENKILNAIVVEISYL